MTKHIMLSYVVVGCIGPIQFRDNFLFIQLLDFTTFVGHYICDIVDKLLNP